MDDVAYKETPMNQIEPDLTFCEEEEEG